VFSKALREALRRHEQRSLEPRLLRQLLQAAALARTDGVSAALPEPLARSATKWWNTTASKVASLSHTGVSSLLKSMKVDHRVMVRLGGGLPTVDIAVEGSQPIAIQVCSFLLHCGGHEMTSLLLMPNHLCRGLHRVNCLQRQGSVDCG
jgi:hypothetical protein